MITREDLKNMEPGTIFASGNIIDGENGVHLKNSGKLLRWVAVRGNVDDWSIYIDVASKDEEKVKNDGDKLPKRVAISLIEGSKDFYDRYRI